MQQRLSSLVKTYEGKAEASLQSTAQQWAVESLLAAESLRAAIWAAWERGVISAPERDAMLQRAKKGVL